MDTKDQIRAIAEFCGHYENLAAIYNRPLSEVKNWSTTDYTKQHYAIFDAARKLSPQDKVRYAHFLAFGEFLSDASIGFEDLSPLDMFELMTLPASKHCEALLRVIGKWEEGA